MILRGLYQGSSDRLGTRVPLTEHLDVTHLVDLLGEQGGAIETGLGRQLTAAYVPNMGPNLKHRGSPLGRSDYAAPLHDLFDALDQTTADRARRVPAVQPPRQRRIVRRRPRI